MAYKKLKSKQSNKTAKKVAGKVTSKSVSSEKPPKKKAVKKKRPKTKKPKSQHYVNGKEFLDKITEYYTTGVIDDELSTMILKISNGLSYAPNFINYSYKDEMVGDAVLKMFSALKHKKFNIASGNNPFSYFTTIAFHAFINRIKKEKKHRDTITKYQETFYQDTLTDAGGSAKPMSNELDHTPQDDNDS